jgi:hypothetical protein
MFLIVEPSDVINIDEIKLIMESHKYSTLISCKILNVEPSGVIKIDHNIWNHVCTMYTSLR